jgi:ParB family transcriptional regulator, chromosome partitioning protein
MSTKKPSIRDRAMLATTNVVTPLPPSTILPLSQRPKTGPGALVAHLAMESGVIRENQQLKEELKSWGDASPTKKLNPSDIAPSRWANRHEDSFAGSEFDLLKAEIASSGGNIQPIKVRPVPNTDPQKFEIVFGHRRHRACLDLGLEVVAMVESITDAALFEEMDRENRQRADLRPYEQGEMYRRALDEGLYPSLRKMADAIGVQAGNVSTAVKLARLPAFVLDAFPSRLDIQYRWSVPLADAVEKAPEALSGRAKAIHEERKSGGQFTAQQVFQRLTATPASSPKVTVRDVRVAGKVVLKVRETKDAVTFEMLTAPKNVINKIEAFIVEALRV